MRVFLVPDRRAAARNEHPDHRRTTRTFIPIRTTGSRSSATGRFDPAISGPRAREYRVRREMTGHQRRRGFHVVAGEYDLAMANLFRCSYTTMTIVMNSGNANGRPLLDSTASGEPANFSDGANQTRWPGTTRADRCGSPPTPTSSRRRSLPSRRRTDRVLSFDPVDADSIRLSSL